MKRSIPIDTLIETLKTPDIRLISLQKDIDLNYFENRKLINSIEIFGDDFDTKDYAFKDTVAVMKNLDLVITCDTSIGHLAGSLNIPTWIALKYVPDWRWHLGRDNSPWYKSIRLFRQSEIGNWDSVFKQMKIELINKI